MQIDFMKETDPDKRAALKLKIEEKARNIAYTFRVDGKNLMFLDGYGDKKYPKSKVSNELVTLGVDQLNLGIIGPVHISSFTYAPLIALVNLRTATSQYGNSTSLDPKVISALVSLWGMKEGAERLRGHRDSFGFMPTNENFSPEQVALFGVMNSLKRTLGYVDEDSKEMGFADIAELVENDGLKMPNTNLNYNQLLDHIRNMRNIQRDFNNFSGEVEINLKEARSDMDAGGALDEDVSALINKFLIDGLTLENVQEYEAFRGIKYKGRNIGVDKILNMVESPGFYRSYLQEMVLIHMMHNLYDIGIPLMEVQGAINVDGNAGIGSDILSMKKKYEDFMKVATETTSEKAVRPMGISTLLGYVGNDGGKRVFVPTTQQGNIGASGLVFGVELYAPMFPHAHEVFDTMVKDLESIRGRSFNLKEREEVLNFVLSYIFSNPSLMDLIDHPVRDRIKLGLRRNGNISLARLVESLKRIRPGNYFLQRMTARLGYRHKDPDILQYVASVAARKDDSKNVVAFYELYNDPETQPLAQALIAYAYLMGGVQTTGSFTKYIPKPILLKHGFGEMLRQLSMEDLKVHMPRIIEQYMQHHPYRTNRFTKGDMKDMLGSVNNNEEFSYITLPAEFDLDVYTLPTSLQNKFMVKSNGDLEIPLVNYITFTNFRTINDRKRKTRELFKVTRKNDDGVLRVEAIPTAGVLFAKEAAWGEDIWPMSERKIYPYGYLSSKNPRIPDRPYSLGRTKPKNVTYGRGKSLMTRFGFDQSDTHRFDAILGEVALNSDNKAYRQLAAMISNMPSFHTDVGVERTDKLRYFRYSYKPGKKRGGKIYIPDIAILNNNTVMFERNLLHESMHAVTYGVIMDYADGKLRGKEANEFMEKLQDQFLVAKQKLLIDKGLESDFTLWLAIRDMISDQQLANQRGEEYTGPMPTEKQMSFFRNARTSFEPFYDIGEYITAAMTDIGFQRELAGIEYMLDNKPESLLDRMIQAITKLLKFISEELGMDIENTLLEATVQTIVRGTMVNWKALDKRISLAPESSPTNDDWGESPTLDGIPDKDFNPDEGIFSMEDVEQGREFRKRCKS